MPNIFIDIITLFSVKISKYKILKRVNTNVKSYQNCIID